MSQYSIHFLYVLFLHCVMQSDTNRWLQLSRDPVTFGKDALLEQVCSLGRPEYISCTLEGLSARKAKRGLMKLNW